MASSIFLEVLLKILVNISAKCAHKGTWDTPLTVRSEDFLFANAAIMEGIANAVSTPQIITTCVSQETERLFVQLGRDQRVFYAALKPRNCNIGKGWGQVAAHKDGNDNIINPFRRDPRPQHGLLLWRLAAGRRNINWTTDRDQGQRKKMKQALTTNIHKRRPARSQTVLAREKAL